jgi:hypothetical protein
MIDMGDDAEISYVLAVHVLTTVARKIPANHARGKAKVGILAGSSRR